MKKSFAWFSIVSALLATSAKAVDVTEYPALEEVYNKMVQEDGVDPEQLNAIFAKAEIKQRTLDLISAPYEAKPWYQYRKIFSDARRVNNGVLFWQANKEAMARAEQEYGVPAEIIAAIIGVETAYGANKGKYRVLDSLVTLSAAYPRRSEYFSKELRVYLNTILAEGIEPDSVEGSYAGAIGIPQFMPSSYQAYSVDFNDNGKRDLVNETDDAIGSVANYLAEHGWQPGGPYYYVIEDADAKIADQSQVSVRGGKGKPVTALSSLPVSAEVKQQFGDNTLAAVYRYGMPEDTKEYVLGFKNFYVVTRYNHSINYARSVVDLANNIAKQYKASQ